MTTPTDTASTPTTDDDPTDTSPGPDVAADPAGRASPTHPYDATNPGATNAATPPPGWPGPATDDPNAYPYRGGSPWIVPGAPERRMRRSSTDRMLAGVCGGIAEYTGIDPVLVRLAFLTSLLFGGIGILFYLAAVLIMPKPLA